MTNSHSANGTSREPTREQVDAVRADFPSAGFSAATEIARLRAEVERLRAVAVRIADMRTSGTAAHTMKSLARVALDRSAL